ncbi:bifunctional YncE family protein/alkaline phosphatase family protein [Alloacidobacterium dinghuense]|uniref:Bifunctional YncE family protein/alkaline phosphatase family protein n=1 Tax=Alloacidobacterium dinghuense TaxID=2763107 RepID=A0A7G8BPH7_9BACT|nr:beta-propeller fold lactonase family protein [Alloacidobacterium dinghuense]QNI34447.1 bifunctional YncE family protein/alkaline phosphatase family protein [Alloacidobacterium dinghuense]
MNRSLLVLSSVAASIFLQSAGLAQTVPLPTSKQIIEPVPGSPQRLNSLPMAMAWSPDHRYLAVINAGFSTVESNYQQSIAVLDTETGKLADFPDSRTDIGAAQTLYNGVAFSGDGSHVYASIDSLKEPEGNGTNPGNAIAVYTFTGSTLTPERLIPIPLQKLAAGRTQNQIGKPIPDGMAIPAPTGLAVVKSKAGAEQILVADEFSDDVLLVDAASGKIVLRFELASHSVVPSQYPIAVVASHDGRRAFVALWNGSAVAELDLESGKVGQTLALLPPDVATSPGSHPTALVLNRDDKTLYVALANRDAVAAVRVNGEHMQLAGMFNSQLPGQRYFGAMPDAVALSPDDATLYAANSGSDAVAVFLTRDLKPNAAAEPKGFIPTQWYPTALATKGSQLYIATAKGKGTGPNAAPQPQPANPSPNQSKRIKRPHTYIGTMLYGSLATVDVTAAERELPQLTSEVVASNMMQAAEQHLEFKASANPIHHVIYIIKENRTYDQIFGDLGTGNGDSSLTMYGRDITPNLHKLALQFGVLDNFYDSGEVSGDGHVWSNAAISSDYTEKNWQQSYRGSARVYDFEGVVEQGYPLLEGIPDVNEPASSYIWTDLAKHGKSLYHFGEFVSTKFCDDSGEAPKDKSPLKGTPEPPREPCKLAAIHKGDAIPANYGGGTSPYPWAIPLIFKNVATKPELDGHFDPQYPDFNLKFPDQLRVEEFLTHFREWVASRHGGQDTMPAFVMLRLPNDHTAGTTPGSPTPKASVSDNDLAVGRAVEAVSHSPYWDDTAFFILEDDAQDGADHVDAHRSIALVISKYSPKAAQPKVDSTFYTTVSFLRTMEDLLGVPPMNNNDAFAPLIAPLFAGTGDQPAFDADYSNRDNGLICTANTPKAPGAKESSKMDFSHEDRADARKLNVILWRDAMGNKPVPWMVTHPHGSHKDDDDDGD